MNLLLNRDFRMPEDGWYQIAPLGEFAHAGAGVVQVVDAEACAAMVNRFAEEAKTANFAGLLVDFDHFSLDGEKRSEAAGWITALENREGGLFAQIRWSDLGEEAVRGGRYRFLSPVWSRSDCQDLGGGRVRPVRLLNAAVTNDPNLKGMRPLSNSRGQRSEVGDQAGEGTTKDAKNAKNANIEQSTSNAQRPTGVVANAGAARFKWVLSGDGKHCPSCAAVAGQVHTMAEWDAAGIRPGGGALYCLGKCKCRLVETAEASTGAVTGAVKRHKPVVANAGIRGPRSEIGGPRVENANVQQSTSNAQHRTEVEHDVKEALRIARIGKVANNWSDEARAASLEVRRAKAAARSQRSEVGDQRSENSGSGEMTRAEVQGRSGESGKKTAAESVKARYTRLRADIEAAAGDSEKLREASKRYLDGRRRDGTDYTLADIEAVRECLKQDKSLTDYQLRMAEKALDEARAWVRGDERGLLAVAEEEIASELTAAGIRLAEVEAVRRIINPLRYYAEFGIDVSTGGLPDWVDDFKAYEELQHQYAFLRPGAKVRTQAFGPTKLDKLMLKSKLTTPAELTETLKTRAEAAARLQGYLPLQTTSKAGAVGRGPVKVVADGVMYENLPMGPKPGLNSMSGKTARLAVETAARDIRVKATRRAGVGKLSVAAALVPMALKALVQVVPTARQQQARAYLDQAAQAGKQAKMPGLVSFLGAGANIFFGDLSASEQFYRAGQPIGSVEGDEEIARWYGRGVKNRTGDGVMDGKIENRWSDVARKASLAVRKAKAAARSARSGGQAVGRSGGEDGKPGPINPDAGYYPGGTPYFDEATGKYVMPKPGQQIPKKLTPDEGIYLGGSRYFDERLGRYVYPGDPEYRKVRVPVR